MAIEEEKMADYHDNEKRRSKFPDKSRLMSTYVRLDIKFDDEKDMNAKKSDLKKMSNMVAGVVHKDMETDVLLKEGSVIMEIVTFGNLHSLLSMENIEAIGIYIKENPEELLLDYVTIRGAVSILAKDIDAVATSLSMCARYIFQATRGVILRIIVEPGVVANFKIFLKACDVAGSEKSSAQKRKNAMEKAHDQLETILDLCKNKDDQELMIKYTDQELRRISDIRTTNQKNKESKHAQDFNEHLSACRKMIKELKEKS